MGPFLFASFMSSIDFESHFIRWVKYADDMTIIELIESPSQILLSSSHIEGKFKSVGLTLNLTKCKEILIQRSNLPENLISTSVFTRVSQLRILGFIFSDSLSWKLQINNVLMRATRRLYIIRCLRNILSNRELILVYHAVITPLLLYAAPTFGKLPKTLLHKLQRFQNRGHRLTCGSDCSCQFFHPLSDIFKKSGLNFLKSCETNLSHPLHAFVPQRLPRSGHYMLKFSSTNRRLHSFFPWFCALSNEM